MIFDEAITAKAESFAAQGSGRLSEKSSPRAKASLAMTLKFGFLAGASAILEVIEDLVGKADGKAARTYADWLPDHLPIFKAYMDGRKHKTIQAEEILVKAIKVEIEYDGGMGMVSPSRLTRALEEWEKLKE